MGRRTRRNSKRSSDLALGSSRSKRNSSGVCYRSKSDLGNLGQMRLRAIDSTDSEGEERAIVQPGSLVLAKSVERFFEKYPPKSTDCSSDSGNQSSSNASVNNATLENTTALSTSVKTFTSTTTTSQMASAVSASVHASPTQGAEQSNAGAVCLDDGHFVQGWTVAERRRLFEK